MCRRVAVRARVCVCVGAGSVVVKGAWGVCGVCGEWCSGRGQSSVCVVWGVWCMRAVVQVQRV